MRSNQSDTAFLFAYLGVLVLQLPLWLCAGLLWAAFMVALAGSHPITALVGGLRYGFFMWGLAGNFLAVILAWRRSAPLPAHDRAALRAALIRACSKLRLVVLAESPDEVVLGPKRVLVRLPRLQEVRLTLDGDESTLTAPAASFGMVRRGTIRALADISAGSRGASAISLIDPD